MSNKGFTLIEMLIVLSCIGILVVCFPLMRPQSSIMLRYQMEELRQTLLHAQQQAITDKKDVIIVLQGNQLIINQRTFSLKKQISCTALPFHFTPLGNISQAQTITCRCEGKQKKLILQLGSGRMHVQ